MTLLRLRLERPYVRQAPDRFRNVDNFTMKVGEHCELLDNVYY